MKFVIIIVLWLEVIVFFAIVIPHVLKFSRLWRAGIKIKQLKLLGYGQAATLSGILIGVGIPKALGIQYDANYDGQWIYLIVNAIGIAILFTGFRLMIASYKPEEENPVWVKWISKLWK